MTFKKKCISDFNCIKQTKRAILVQFQQKMGSKVTINPEAHIFVWTLNFVEIYYSLTYFIVYLFVSPLLKWKFSEILEIPKVPFPKLKHFICAMVLQVGTTSGISNPYIYNSVWRGK
jgi:hypothetical protein